MSLVPWALNLAERGWVADPLIRHGIRRLLENRVRQINSLPDATTRVAERMYDSPLAVETEAANEQHYELPPTFFEIVLGSHLKYSCCEWSEDTMSLGDAEAAALATVCSRSQVMDGMKVLDLGCGWGSFTLWLAEKYPDCRVTAVSNSAPQGEYIRQQAGARGLPNVEVLSADMNHLELTTRFDRVVSIEMFEHMRNYPLLLERIAGWLKVDGKLFIHIFCHRSSPYFFEDAGPSDWMARHFFSGGLMPSEGLLESFAGPVQLEDRWRINGKHYEKTALAWLGNMDRHRDEIRTLFESVYGLDAERWFHRWRLFFLACAELFAYREGEEWFVSHSLWGANQAATS